MAAANGRVKRIRKHTDLDVYQRAFKASMEIFRLTKRFPKEEIYSLTSQIRRSSRSVSANLAEAWRKRRYDAAFIASWAIVKQKPPKRRCGFNTPWSASI